jgi:selenide,water dikinase
MLAHDAHAATDVTGYGLLGHSYEMAAASGVTIHLLAKQLPLLPEALNLAEAGMIPAGANDNRAFLEGKVLVADTVDPNLERVAFDPQTSGGLLIAIPADKAEAFENGLKEQGLLHAPIGQVEHKGGVAVILG